MAELDDLDDFVLGLPPRMPDAVWKAALDAAFRLSGSDDLDDSAEASDPVFVKDDDDDQEAADQSGFDSPSDIDDGVADNHAWGDTDD
ncbi:hypothetical protein WJX64_02915 [Leifsonia sp. YIM 134122]|uniref:Uncharacterized protein n=1 Tax=Leifsonia stereocauli TaxID=3134136 RepID=A0ABU9W0F5_9MICO